MASEVTADIIAATNYTSLSADFYVRTPYVAPQQFFDVLSTSAKPVVTAGVFNLNSPVTMDKTGQEIVANPGEEWYNRIHLIPSATELGNLLSAQTVDIEVWNGFFVPRTLVSVTESGTDGIAIVGPSDPPLEYNALQSHLYQVQVDIIGPPAVDGQYRFNFDVYTVTFSVTGNRVVVLSVVPQAEFTEVLEWKTDVIKTKGSEQRVALRPIPRQSLSYDYVLSERDFATLKGTMQEWSHRMFSVPLWSDAEFVGVVNAGGTTIPVDDSFADYVSDGMALIFQDQYQFEAVELLDINPGSTELKMPIVGNYTSAFIMPVLLARTLGGFDFKRGASTTIQGSATFMGTTTNDIGFSDKTQYKGRDILLERSAKVSSAKETIEMDLNKIDQGIGVVVVDPKRNEFEHSQSLSFDMVNKEELWSVRTWVHSRKGKQKSFYVLTWNRDLTLVNDLTAATSVLTVESIKYSLYRTNTDIAIVKKDGSILLREGTSAVDNGDGTESVVLTAQIGEDISMSDIDLICFVVLVRLNSDRVEIKHGAHKQATIVVPITRIME